MYIISFLSIFLASWYFYENLGGEDMKLIRRNLGDGVKYLGKDRSKLKHVFAMPFGKEVDTDKIQNILSGFLGKRVEVSFNKYLYVQVFDWELKRKYVMPEIEKKTNSRVLLGETYHGKWYHNFLKYPHMIVAGHTGYGKTNFIKTLLGQLDGEILLIDMKNDGDYPVTSATDVHGAKTMLEKLSREKKRKRHIFVVVDEAAELLPPEYLKTKDEKEPYLKCQMYLHQIARMGRSRKIHLIFCTQYPTANVIPGSIKQNCETRVVFRLPTQVGSGVALDEPGAEELPAGLYGRAIFKNDRNLEMQTYKFEGESIDAEIRTAEAQRVGDSESDREGPNHDGSSTKEVKRWQIG